MYFLSPTSFLLHYISHIYLILVSPSVSHLSHSCLSVCLTSTSFLSLRLSHIYLILISPFVSHLSHSYLSVCLTSISFLLDFLSVSSYLFSLLQSVCILLRLLCTSKLHVCIFLFPTFCLDALPFKSDLIPAHY